MHLVYACVSVCVRVGECVANKIATTMHRIHEMCKHSRLTVEIVQSNVCTEHGMGIDMADSIRGGVWENRRKNTG